MAKGQITIPRDVRDVLGVSNSDRVTFIVEGNTVRIVNSAVYAINENPNSLSLLFFLRLLTNSPFCLHSLLLIDLADDIIIIKEQ